MRIDVNTPEGAEIRNRYICVDLDARAEIPLVRWADDSTGEYLQMVTDEKGDLVPNEAMDDCKCELKRGNIMLVRLHQNSPILVNRPHHEPGERYGDG